jgi:hypothetical protein
VIETIRLYVARCDGCGLELGQGYGHRETYDTTIEARNGATDAGWTTHPDGSLYCDQGGHA